MLDFGDDPEDTMLELSNGDDRRRLQGVIDCMSTTAATYTWSAQALAIFDWFEKPSTKGFDNLVVRARAGTGKTTVIMEGVRRAPEQAILVAAFSKIIQEELTRRIGISTTIKAQTLHSVGYACIRRFRERIKVEFTSDRADRLADTVCGRVAPDTIKRLVSKLHTKGREIAPHANKVGDLTSIAITFECEPDESWERSGFGLRYVEEKALEAMDLAADVQSGDTIDGSDMIFLPVRNGWMTPMFDLVVVDEAQDMTTAQLEIARGVCKPGGRIAVVGDDRQAIFGFRGADSQALDRLKVELHAVELGLTKTYRCGRAIVDLARSYVPDYDAADTNPEGEIINLNTSLLVQTASVSDFILSRTNAPLVSIAMQLLRSGKRARVAGRDIGKGLVALVRKLRARSVPELRAKIEAWATREEQRHQAALKQATNGRKAAIEAKIEAVKDQADMLASLTDGAKSVADVENRVETLFVDNGLGAQGVITCSSVHRAKGLEANRVFILRDTLRDWNTEEQNISYVAITRAKHTLVWVADNFPVTTGATA